MKTTSNKDPCFLSLQFELVCFLERERRRRKEREKFEALRNGVRIFPWKSSLRISLRSLCLSRVSFSLQICSSIYLHCVCFSRTSMYSTSSYLNLMWFCLVYGFLCIVREARFFFVVYRDRWIQNFKLMRNMIIRVDLIYLNFNFF